MKNEEPKIKRILHISSRTWYDRPNSNGYWSCFVTETDTMTGEDKTILGIPFQYGYPDNENALSELRKKGLIPDVGFSGFKDAGIKIIQSVEVCTKRKAQNWGTLSV